MLMTRASLKRYAVVKVLPRACSQRTLGGGPCSGCVSGLPHCGKLPCERLLFLRTPGNYHTSFGTCQGFLGGLLWDMLRTLFGSVSRFPFLAFTLGVSAFQKGFFRPTQRRV